LFKTVISGVATDASFSLKALSTWVTVLSAGLNLEGVIWTDDTSGSFFSASETSGTDFITTISRLNSDGSLCGESFLAWCAGVTAGNVLVRIGSAVNTCGSITTGLTLVTDLQAETEIISSGDSICGGTKSTVGAGLSARAIFESIGIAFLTSWSLISSGETSSTDLETLFLGDGSGHVVCGGSLFTWSAGISALSNLEGVGRAFNTLWSSIGSSRARGAHHEAVITAVRSCSSEGVGHGIEWAGIAGLTALTSLVGVSTAFYTAGSLLSGGGTRSADL